MEEKIRRIGEPAGGRKSGLHRGNYAGLEPISYRFVQIHVER